jgi:hypothetical protein
MSGAISSFDLSNYRFVMLVSISHLETVQTPQNVLDVIDTLIGQKSRQRVWVMMSKGLYLNNCALNGHVIARKLLEVCLHYRLRFNREIRRRAQASEVEYGDSLRFIDWEQLSSEKPREFLRNLHKVELLYESSPIFARLINTDIVNLKKAIDDGTRGFLFEEYAGLTVLSMNNINTLLTESEDCRGTVMVYPGPMLPSMKWALAELQRGSSNDQAIRYLDSANRQLHIIRGPRDTEVHSLDTKSLRAPSIGSADRLAQSASLEM